MLNLPRARSIEAHQMPQLVQAGGLVYVPGSSGAPQEFMTELLREPTCTEGARILTTYVPSINRLELQGLHATGEVTGLFMQPGVTQAQRDGRFRALPLSYSGFVRHLNEHVDVDLTVVQVSAPDAQGNCSLGPAVEFMPVVLNKSRRVLALINRQTPRIPGAVSIPYSRFDYVCEVDTPLPNYSAPADAITEAISRNIVSLIEDGCTLQAGLGKVPTALMQLLHDRRRLRMHSGMLSDGFLELAKAGALDMSYPHTTCVLVGSQRFYEQAAEFESLRVLGCDVTHSAATLNAIDRFVAVNSALEVDLFGQCNLEHANGMAVSGCGGAPDFARAGRMSVGGRSIVALPSRHKTGSRITPQLSEHSVVTLSRIDVDFVVTEHGVANLNGASVHERAEALISVAAPEFRDTLLASWRGIAARL
ncbi:hypothetical protein G7048_26150 (plasmid) [Diaphorobacter sp. HDW4B]|nr:hypothetical protein G7048_26150 [Diaphorobacter sp. HDW4B]